MLGPFNCMMRNCKYCIFRELVALCASSWCVLFTSKSRGFQDLQVIKSTWENILKGGVQWILGSELELIRCGFRHSVWDASCWKSWTSGKKTGRWQGCHAFAYVFFWLGFPPTVAKFSFPECLPQLFCETAWKRSYSHSLPCHALKALGVYNMVEITTTFLQLFDLKVTCLLAETEQITFLIHHFLIDLSSVGTILARWYSSGTERICNVSKGGIQ